MLKEISKFVKKVFDFNINKADQLYNILLKDIQLVLSDDHKVSSSKQIKGKLYCKYQSVFGHTTNTCMCFTEINLYEGRYCSTPSGSQLF